MNTARGVYDTAMSTPTTNRDNAINGAINGFETWVNSNPIRTAIRNRVNPLVTDLNNDLVSYQTAADSAETTFKNEVLTANQKYWDAVYPLGTSPTTPYQTFQNTMTALRASWGTNLQADFTVRQ